MSIRSDPQGLNGQLERVRKVPLCHFWRVDGLWSRLWVPQGLKALGVLRHAQWSWDPVVLELDGGPGWALGWAWRRLKKKMEVKFSGRKKSVSVEKIYLSIDLTLALTLDWTGPDPSPSPNPS